MKEIICGKCVRFQKGYKTCKFGIPQKRTRCHQFSIADGSGLLAKKMQYSLSPSDWRGNRCDVFRILDEAKKEFRLEVAADNYDWFQKWFGATEQAVRITNE